MPNRNVKMVTKYEENIEKEVKAEKNKLLDSEYSSVYGVCSYFATFLMMIGDAFIKESKISNIINSIVFVIAIIVSCKLKRKIKKSIENNKKMRFSDLTVNFGYMGFILGGFTLFINIADECWYKIFILVIAVALSAAGIVYPIRMEKLRNKKKCDIKNNKK